MRHASQFRISGSIAAAVLYSLLISGCKKDDNTPGPALTNDVFKSVTLAPAAGPALVASSAVPDAADQFLYFTGSGAGGNGVYKVPAAGGTATPVFIGAPFSNPLDLAFSTDNQTIFVADPSAAGGGAVFMLSTGGSTPVAVAGTTGSRPAALDVIQRNGTDMVYYCGTNAADGQPAVYELAVSGAATPLIRYKGAPLVSPSGIVSAKDGTLYIADESGTVYRLSTTNILTQIGSGIVMGHPAGIALTPDDKIAAISAKNKFYGTAQVQLINLETGSMSVFNKVIGSNYDSGGLHGARDAGGGTGVYGWADLTSGIGGHVYRVSLR